MALTIPEELAGLIDEADASQLPIDFLGLAGRMSEALPKDATLSIEERRGAFAEIEALRFQPPHGERYPWGVYWTPLGSGTRQDGTEFHSPDIADVDEEIISHWMLRSERTKHPAFQARFSDLVWEIGRYLKRGASATDTNTRNPIAIDIPVSYAHRAIDAYIECTARTFNDDEYTAWQYLDRAIELAVSVNDAARIEGSKQALFVLRDRWAGEQRQMWWRFDDLTWEYAKALNITDTEKQFVIDTLEQILTTSADHTNPQCFNPRDAMSVAERLVRRRTQRNELDEAKRAIRTAALAFEEAAKAANGLTAIAWLQDLIPRYRNLGMVDDAARVEQVIRSRAGEAKAELQHVEVPYTVPKAEMDAWVNRILGNTVDEALGRIALGCMIKKDATEKSVRDIHKNAPLSALMPLSIMDAQGFTTATIGSINDDIEGRSIQHAADQFNWRAPWLYLALTRGKEKYKFDVNKIVECITSSGWFPPEREPLLKNGLEAWFADDPVRAIHILVPQIEAALRDVLAALGASVRLPDKNLGGFQVIGMGKVLNDQSFIARMPADVRFHLRALYCDPRGINLRNQLAHGLAHPEIFGMGLANWVMHSVLLIGMIRVQPHTS